MNPIFGNICKKICKSYLEKIKNEKVNNKILIYLIYYNQFVVSLNQNEIR